MNKKIINSKMEILKDFFHIDNNYIKNLLNNEKITEKFDFSNLTIVEILKLTRNLNLSLAVLEEIFCKQDFDEQGLKEKLTLFKTNGIVRKVDELGRVVLPVEQRNFLKVLEKDTMEISLDFLGNFLIKPQKRCISCGRTEDLTKINELYLCGNCITHCNNDRNS